MSILLNKLSNTFEKSGSASNSPKGARTPPQPTTPSSHRHTNGHHQTPPPPQQQQQQHFIGRKPVITTRRLFSLSELVGTDLTLLIDDHLMIRIFSLLTYQELFIVKRVCSRWKPLCENKCIYKDLDMQSFIVNCRILPNQILNTFISTLSMSHDELDALKMVCRDMPRITFNNSNNNNNNNSLNSNNEAPFGSIDFNSSNNNNNSISLPSSPTIHASISSSNSNSFLSHHNSLNSTNGSNKHLRVSSLDESSLTNSSSSIGSTSSSTTTTTTGSYMVDHTTPNGGRKHSDKELKKKEKQRKEREKRLEDSIKVWTEDVIPNWDKRKGTKKARELVCQGIPSLVRSKVWPLLIGNDLNITPELFSIFGARAERAKQRTESNSLGREGTVSLIHLDLPRTFPMLSIFQDDGPLHQSLANILEAYVCYRPDVGYVQGMSYLAAVFLLILDEFNAFVCLTNFLNNPCYMAFYTMNLNQMEVYMKAMDSLMFTHIPKIHRHLKELGIQPDVFMIDWVLTVFSKSLPLDVASHVWDTIFLDGEIVIFQTALGILKTYSKELENGDFDLCMTLLTHLPTDIDEDELFQNINSFTINPKLFDKIILNNTNSNNKN
ncbi:hypothetical protein CYY_010066 [Polysphondylium violaceum]|uniref:Rab-GAP TBC domain-containing protein n=1 Tax=Polysphondylium violaceum TaxID=133409 RepID=A0A8J4V2B9_9MYCE|nr:hypothetical protein CYY_010066 [Polysphondylium violaceum]